MCLEVILDSRFIRTHDVQARELEYVGSVGLGVGDIIESEA